MESVHQATYFCPGCGALRTRDAKRCTSCGRVFEIDFEGDISERPYILANPQVKAPYYKRSKVNLFLDKLLSFESIVMMIGVVMILMAVRGLLPYVIGTRTAATVTDIEAMNCRADCQYLVKYEFTDAQGIVRSGQYHWSYEDYAFHPPKEGQTTIIRYVPHLIPVLQPVAVDAWFPWGLYLAAAFGVLCIVAVQRGWL